MGCCIRGRRREVDDRRWRTLISGPIYSLCSVNVSIMTTLHLSELLIVLCSELLALMLGQDLYGREVGD